MLLFGGAAGSLKSATMLVDAIQYRDLPRASSIIFRRTYPELEELIEMSRSIYPLAAGSYNATAKTWRFPSGMRMKFRQCERDAEITRFQGHQYDFIGFDESTHFNEFPVRYMISRARSKDPFLQNRIRIRLASNPGARGHQWHKKMFMGPVCPHCRPLQDDSRIPGKVYHDARWSSDSRPVKLSTAFIPGRLSDHNLLGPEYLHRLESLPATLAKALKEGCWEVFSGQYFDCWDEDRMVVNRQHIREEWWWPFWTGSDYGFSGSHAVSYLFTRAPSGVVYIIGELPRSHRKASDFATDIRDTWVTPEMYKNRRLIANYMSFDMWNQTGDTHTRADQMTEASGLMFEKSTKDRLGSAMLLYTMLDGGNLLVANTCKKLIASVPSRVHDEEGNPDDVLKVEKDEYDDCYDACRYGLYGYMRSAEKPAQQAIMEAVTSSDPTTAMMQYQMAVNKTNQGQEPASFMGGSWRWNKWGRER